MGPETIWIFIPLFALSIPIIGLWTKHRQKIVEMQVNATASLSAEKAAQYASHSRELEERVRVLERIVTDKGYDVASQIEALRDSRKVEALLDSREKEIR
jgi:hypothetical protein